MKNFIKNYGASYYFINYYEKNTLFMAFHTLFTFIKDFKKPLKIGKSEK